MRRRITVLAAVITLVAGSFAPARADDRSTDSARDHLIVVDASDSAHGDRVAAAIGAAHPVWSAGPIVLVATLTPLQAAAVADLPGVVDVVPDEIVAALPVEARSGLLTPLPDLQSRLLPRSLSVLVHGHQQVPAGIGTINGLDSPTASIDGSDDRVDVDIAIIDSGIDVTHADLNLAGGVGCTSPAVPGTSALFHDLNGHGTHVAGIAAAKDNAFGVVGVAPGARVWAVKVLGDGHTTTTASQILCGLDWVVRHHDVIDVANMSLGFVGAVDQASCDDDDAGETNIGLAMVRDAVCAVVEAGVSVVASAGNDAADARQQTPANIDDVLTVSAWSDFDGRPGELSGPTCRGGFDQPDDALGTFSNFGPDVDIAAPGVCIYSTVHASAYEYITGTSMAAPHVAGAAALVLAGQPDLSPAEVADVLLTRARPGPLAGDPDDSPEPLLDVSGL